ncbi:nuclear body protein SP140-like protein [Xyrauchen texanus]|uniref:nuclear body protein SP140-like protein n=1 Tax=Xyrauchen texanus TaxID=154827 RepID=UPI0022418CC5|nr:nuclear body protein SP140-like protein [Xyrauchen texanus]
MDLGFFTKEQLFDVFRKNKTKLSTIKKPKTLLRHLEDNGVIRKGLYEEQKLVEDPDESVYKVLTHIEKMGKEHVWKFWNCVNQEHILERYSQLSKLTKELNIELKNSHESNYLRKNNNTAEKSKHQDAGKETVVKKRKSESNCESIQAGPSSQSTTSQRKTPEHVGRAPDSHSLRKNNKTAEKSKHQDAGKETVVKKRKSESNCESNKAGPSSQSTTSQRKTAEHVGREEQKDLWDLPVNKKWLPVKCGKEKAKLNRNALNRRKRDCIKHRGKIITPWKFEQLGGKESCHNWKKSILCQGINLITLMKRGDLKIPGHVGKFTLRK